MAIIGGGPAGLTAAYLLSQAGVDCAVFEANPDYLGGISRTVNYKGFLLDIGGHRFFSKSEEVENFWTEILGEDLVERKRSSRILYRGKLFTYPLKPLEALFKLGPLETSLCIASYIRRKIFPIKNPRSFADWVSNQFGDRLFGIFFKTYTEKVWGMSCQNISADWAAQRIKGLSLFRTILNAFFPQKVLRGVARGGVKTLIESFRYPRRGPGMLWDRAAELAQVNGAKILKGHKVIGLEFLESQASWKLRVLDEKGQELMVFAKQVISSAPLQEIVRDLSPESSVKDEASKLGYRDFMVVGVILRDRQLMTENWIYVHDPEVKVGRIQNFKAWSPEMVPDESMVAYGMEYFCFKDDGLWSLPDDEMVAMATSELIKLGLATREDIVDACVIRQEKAYPVYDEGYQERVQMIRREFDSRYPTLHAVGRNGMHKYNNQDHAIMTAMLTVRNILADQKLYDVWTVNEDAEYHEEVASKSVTFGSSALRGVPRPLDRL